MKIVASGSRRTQLCVSLNVAPRTFYLTVDLLGTILDEIRVLLFNNYSMDQWQTFETIQTQGMVRKVELYKADRVLCRSMRQFS
jgi:hypothetical protein